jgi:hypothetical protein
MKALKWFGISALSFFLFICLLPFGALFTVNQTVLDSSFVTSHIDNLDFSTVAREVLKEQVWTQLPQALPGEGADFRDKLLDSTIPALEPWAKEQASRLVNAGYDYILGRSDAFAVDISLAPVQAVLKEKAWALYQATPPPEAARLTSTQLRQLFEQGYAVFTQSIPVAVTIGEATLNGAVTNALSGARTGVFYFRVGFFALIGLMLLLAAGIILLCRRIRSSTRVLGSVFFVVGLLQLATVIVLQVFVFPLLSLPVIVSPTLLAWFSGLLHDLIMPLQWLAVGLSISGVAMIVVSCIYKPKPKAKTPELVKAA